MSCDVCRAYITLLPFPHTVLLQQGCPRVDKARLIHPIVQVTLHTAVQVVTARHAICRHSSQTLLERLQITVSTVQVRRIYILSYIDPSSAPLHVNVQAPASRQGLPSGQDRRKAFLPALADFETCNYGGYGCSSSVLCMCYTSVTV